MEDNFIEINVQDKYELKKKHPCGSNFFEVIRSGVDCKIKCLGCGHIITISRIELRKSIKKKVD